MDIPTKFETLRLKQGWLEIEGRQTMRSHLFFRYADDAVTIKLQLSPAQAREIAAKLRAVADFCDEEG